MSQLITLRCDCNQAVALAIQLLGEYNLKSWQSFDLRSAANSPALYSCPRHETDSCACNLVFLLVYAAEGRPATLVFHGYDGQTWIALDGSQEQRPEVGLEQSIKKALTVDAFARLSNKRALSTN